MDKYSRFAEAVSRVSQFHPKFRAVATTVGDGWVEIDVVATSTEATVEGLGRLLKGLKAASQKEGVALVLDTRGFAGIDLEPYGFERFHEDRVVFRSDPAWRSALETSPDFSFRKVESISDELTGKRGANAFAELVTRLMDAAAWPDRGKAFDRLRIAIARRGETGLDGIMEDLGIGSARPSYLGLG